MFVQIKAPDYLMGTNANFGVLDATIKEVNQVYEAFAHRFQGIDSGVLPQVPQPIMHQIYTSVYAKITRWVERHRTSTELTTSYSGAEDCRIPTATGTTNVHTA